MFRKGKTRRSVPIATREASVAVLGFLIIEIGRSSILVLAAKFKEEVRNKTAANVRVSDGLAKETSLQGAPRALRYWLDFY